MKLLVFGATGQVACALRRIAPDAVYLGRQQADLTDADACARAVLNHEADAVINAAAYTAVDRAETEEDLARRINAEAPGAMARAAAARAIPFVHISTDYVFDGQGDRPWRPEDPVRPVNAYGRSKAEGETRIRAAQGVHAILRTSWVFSADGRNFVKTMLGLGDSRNELSIVEDQIGGPTAAEDIAAACLKIAADLARDGTRSGTYHFSGEPEVSWKDFAEQIFAMSGQAVRIRGLSTAEYPTPAKRPLNSRLDCAETERVFGVTRPDWRVSLRKVLGDLGRLA